VRVIELSHDRAWIEVDYDGGYTQQAAFDLVWPEQIEAWLVKRAPEADQHPRKGRAPRGVQHLSTYWRCDEIELTPS